MFDIIRELATLPPDPDGVCEIAEDCVLPLGFGP